jgi:predicted small metal-binding protein
MTKFKAEDKTMETKKEFKELSCSDFRPDCDFTVRAATEEELLDKCQEHACNVHSKCGESPEIREKLRSRIRAVV